MSHSARAACALACVATLAACASRPPQARGPGGGGFTGLVARPIALLFTDFDANRDRRVTREEHRAGADAAWREADVDGDGALSPFEFIDWLTAAMGSESATPGRTAFDGDLDNTITHDEFLDTLDEEFARIDANGDGVIERAELVRLIEPSFNPRDAEDRPPSRGGRDRRGPGEGGEPFPDADDAEPEGATIRAPSAHR